MWSQNTPPVIMHIPCAPLGERRRETEKPQIVVPNIAALPSTRLCYSQSLSKCRKRQPSCGGAVYNRGETRKNIITNNKKHTRNLRKQSSARSWRSPPSRRRQPASKPVVPTSRPLSYAYMHAVCESCSLRICDTLLPLSGTVRHQNPFQGKEHNLRVH